jgi:hypothetical protein
LDSLNRESAEHASELQSLDAALRMAGEKLAKAREREAARADKAAAMELLAELGRFRELGRVDGFAEREIWNIRAGLTLA